MGMLVTGAEGYLDNAVAPTLLGDHHDAVGWIPNIKARWSCPGSPGGNFNRIGQAEYQVSRGAGRWARVSEGAVQ